MCDTCGCNLTPANEHLANAGWHLHQKTGAGHESVEVLSELFHANDEQALLNRQHFDTLRVLAVNVMSAL